MKERKHKRISKEALEKAKVLFETHPKMTWPELSQETGINASSLRHACLRLWGLQKRGPRHKAVTVQAEPNSNLDILKSEPPTNGIDLIDKLTERLEHYKVLKAENTTLRLQIFELHKANRQTLEKLVRLQNIMSQPD